MSNDDDFTRWQLAIGSSKRYPPKWWERRAYAAGVRDAMRIMEAARSRNWESVCKTEMPKYKVPCWNCDEGFVEMVDEWDSEICSECKGEGFLIVTELTDDNCEEAILLKDEPHHSAR